MLRRRRSLRPAQRGNVVKGLAVNVAVTAIAFVVLLYLLPDSMLKFTGDTPQLVLLALIVGLVNALIKPVVKALSFPISMLTLGLFGLVINAGLLLVVAWGVQNIAKLNLSVGGFPANGITADTILAAVVASVALSIISTIIGLVIHD